MRREPDPTDWTDYPDDAFGVEDFQSLLDLFEGASTALRPGSLVTGTVLSVKDNYVFVNIDYKSEGKIPLEQLRHEAFFGAITKGMSLEAVVETAEDADGYILLSFEKVGRKKVYEELEACFNTGRSVCGKAIEVVKGGLMVDVGVRAFLPGSQIDLHPVPDLCRLVGQEFELKVIQFNRFRRNVVVSRRALLEDRQLHLRQEILAKLSPGQILEGVVKNITDYGVFLNLGGLDGLLHKTDISWGRVEHPADHFRLGQRIRVMVLHHDRDSNKVSLGYKQLEPDPWKTAAERIPPGTVVTGRVQSYAPYGLFVEVERGIEGLLHRSEMSWNPFDLSFRDRFRPGDPVQVQILNIDVQARRLSLSVRRMLPNPWEQLQGRCRPGDCLEVRVCAADDYGILVEAAPQVVGRIHRSDLSWSRHPGEAPCVVGQRLQAVVLEFNPAAQKLILGLKQLEENAWEKFCSGHQPGELLQGVVTRLVDFGAFIRLADGIEGLCHISEFPEPAEPGPAAFARIGQPVWVRLLKLNPVDRRISLSARHLPEGVLVAPAIPNSVS
jgi:small subunit ribosomal protein S1